MTGDRPAGAAEGRGWLSLLVIAAVLYLPFLGTRDLWFPDEPVIAEVAQEMFLSGDWITPKRVGVPWVDYPPMVYWAATVSSRVLGGISEFSLRLPGALAAIGMVMLTWLAGRRWFGDRAGWWSGFALATFLLFVYEANSYRPDMLFALAIAAGLIVYARGAGPRPRWLPRIAGFALLGAAMLSKGPLGLLLPGLVLTLWHGTRREWRRLLALAPLSLVALAVYLPWFVACARAMGADSILHELYAQNFQRFYSGSRGHEQPIYYYLVKIWMDLFPWSPLLPFAIARAVSRRHRSERHAQLALWWLGAFFVFLSLAVTKRELYMLPAYPAAALLLGPWLAAVAGGQSLKAEAPSARPVRAYSGVLAVVLLLFGLLAIVAGASFEAFAPRLELDAAEELVARGVRLPLVGFGVALVVAGLWIGHAWRRAAVRPALLRIGLASVPLYLLILAWVMPPFAPTKSYAPQSRWIRERIGDEERYGMVNPWNGYIKRSAFAFYSEARVDLLETRDDVESYLRQRPGTVVLVDDRAVPEIFADDEAAWRARTLREIRAGSQLYHVVRAPDADAD